MLSHIKDLITIVGGIGAITALWKSGSAVVHFCDSFNEMKKHERENYLSLLKLTIMSDNMPLGERVIAAEKYLKEGGNGEVKEYIEVNLHINETIKE